MEQSFREHICLIGRRLYERDLIGATEGNISVRLDSTTILSTPTGVSKGHLQPEDIVLLHPDGSQISDGNRSSSEIRVHLDMYKHREDVFAIVHAHPVFATGYAYAGRTIDTNYSPEGSAVLGSVAMVPFAPPGTDALPAAIRQFSAAHDTFLLERHGALTVGPTLEAAFFRMETLERLCRVMLVESVIRATELLPSGEKERLPSLLSSVKF